MGYSSTNIHFDYEGHFSKSGDDYEWILSNGRLYVISFKASSLEEITYLLLKEWTCRNMIIDRLLRGMNMSYISVVKPKRQSYILDDEDVFAYLTSVDKEQRRSILHVEDIKELEVVPITKQLSRAGKESSYCGNYSEPESEVEEVDNVGTGLDNTDMVENKDNADNPVVSGVICEYVEFPHAAEEIRVITEWEDDMGIEMFHEFPSNDVVKDLIDRASH
ncbi:hypothetical protein N665_0346s0006 [Sinapis alba]|nr:hypothetical protein N665_0346s0006 [Sinapis alba]